MNLFGEMQDNEKYTARLIKMIQAGETVTVHGTPDAIGSRYYLHARNQADASLYILNNIEPVMYSDGGKHDRPCRYNVVGDVEIDNLELANIVAKELGKELKYVFVDVHSCRPGHDRRYALSGEKLSKMGWVAPSKFKESLRKYIYWALDEKNKQWL